ncbi:hypothetical protein BP5796_13228 [Coleophoma crateriformis]|uniref:Zn(2)-C6 fungal-type domain-containing protein n=1 Tax=Coleophoma crateriformis TaxID=565419 RepID=A0A3D8Q361_9HELO|nr:hypothetical protein BP5796_13228 [Coleophoma crateriformis]
MATGVLSFVFWAVIIIALCVLSLYRAACDEKQPQCNHCTDRGYVCKYIDGGSLVWVEEKNLRASVPSTLSTPDSTGQPLSWAETTTRGSLSPPNPRTGVETSSLELAKPHENSPSLNCENLDLMINWFTSTIPSLAVNDDNFQEIQQFISRKAMSHQFLMHGILALSALHLADQQDGPEQKKYSTIALAHHNQALALFGPELNNINESNFGACIGFSSIIMLFSFGLSRPLPTTKDLSAVNDMGQIFLLIRGWQKTVEVAQSVCARQLLPAASAINDIPDHIEMALKHLRDLNRLKGQRQKGHDTKTYAEAITSLRSTFQQMDPENPSPFSHREFFVGVSDRFFEYWIAHKTKTLRKGRGVI